MRKLEIDETELIEFFGVLPTEQDPEEQEFFGSTIFHLQQDGLDLRISFSAYFEDCYLDLKTENAEEPFLEVQLKQVREVKLIRDKPDATPILRVIALSDIENEVEASSAIVVQMTVQPRLRVIMRNWRWR
jgi:hypothetical protein